MGTAVCVSALLILGIAQADTTANRLVDTVAFAPFGAGLGVFIALSNHATLEAAPTSLTGDAGSMLNLMRVLGISLGVGAASSTLATAHQKFLSIGDYNGTSTCPLLLSECLRCVVWLATER